MWVERIIKQKIERRFKMKIKGAVLREPHKPYTIEDLELDPPKEKEVLVKYVYTG
jgi:Zn-dependent alcohol dehydrogenase